MRYYNKTNFFSNNYNIINIFLNNIYIIILFITKYNLLLLLTLFKGSEIKCTWCNDIHIIIHIRIMLLIDSNY